MKISHSQKIENQEGGLRPEKGVPSIEKKSIGWVYGVVESYQRRWLGEVEELLEGWGFEVKLCEQYDFKDLYIPRPVKIVYIGAYWTIDGEPRMISVGFSHVDWICKLPQMLFFRIMRDRLRRSYYAKPGVLL